MRLPELVEKEKERKQVLSPSQEDTRSIRCVLMFVNAWVPGRQVMCCCPIACSPKRCKLVLPHSLGNNPCFMIVYRACVCV